MQKTTIVDWRHQFIITSNATLIDELPQNWKLNSVIGTNIECRYHDSLPINKVMLYEKELLVLGWAINLKTGLLINEDSNLRCKKTDLAGRFIAVDISDMSVFGDPLMSQPAVFNSKLNAIASTPNVIASFFNESLEFDADIDQNLNENSGGFYPFGMTPYIHYRRLLCNHEYSLLSKKTCRFYKFTKLANLSDEQHLEKISQSVSQVMSAYINEGDTQIALSAGKETRFMLACSLENKHKLRFMTRYDYDPGSEQDFITAKHIAKKFNLNHVGIIKSHYKSLSTVDKENWLSRVGYAVAGNPLKSYNLIDSEKKDFFSLTGIGGEFIRGFYWNAYKSYKTKLTPELLLKITALPLTKSYIREATTYLDSLDKKLNDYDILDVFYLENRVAAFSSPHKYGCINGINFVTPFSSRCFIEHGFSLSKKIKATDMSLVKVIKAKSEFLGRLPFNLPINIYGWCKPYYFKKIMRALKSRILK